MAFKPDARTCMPVSVIQGGVDHTWTDSGLNPDDPLNCEEPLSRPRRRKRALAGAGFGERTCERGVDQKPDNRAKRSEMRTVYGTPTKSDAWISRPLSCAASAYSCHGKVSGPTCSASA